MADKNTKRAGAIIAGVAGLTAAAVGTYFLYGSKDAKKNRQKVKGWMLKAKGEILEELEKAGDVTESVYHSAVDAVIKKYNELKSIDPAELQAFLEDMRDEWNAIAPKAEVKGRKTRTAKRSSAKKK